MVKEKLLEVKNLKKYFEIYHSYLQKSKVYLKAVDDVTFDVYKGETLGIVGESGCGKSTLGRTIIRLYEKDGGEVYFKGSDIFKLNKNELKVMRKKMQMIFQDPYSSLNPRKNVKSILSQPFYIHKVIEKKDINNKIESLLDDVSLDVKYKKRFPHQFSGGQRQRIGIARALALNPELIICDEAVSALDVSVQAQILNLLIDLQDKYKLTYIFIAHDLSVIEFISTRIMVMYLGKIVEYAPKKELISKHYHPYTKALFEASPVINPRHRSDKKIIMGDVPSPIKPPEGCHFHPRCPFAFDICKNKYPDLKEYYPDHFIACHLYDENYR